METGLKQARVWASIVRKIWDDPSIKTELIDDPHAFLKEHGLDLSAQQAIHILENTDEHLYLVIPQKPSKEISDELLSHIVAGMHYV